METMPQAPRNLKESQYPRTLKAAFGPYAELDVSKKHWSETVLFWPVVAAVAVVLYVLLYVSMAIF